jgi:hypothetical protein
MAGGGLPANKIQVTNNHNTGPNFFSGYHEIHLDLFAIFPKIHIDLDGRRVKVRKLTLSNAVGFESIMPPAIARHILNSNITA